jgi:hypothetical protein
MAINNLPVDMIKDIEFLKYKIINNCSGEGDIEEIKAIVEKLEKEVEEVLNNINTNCGKVCEYKFDDSEIEVFKLKIDQDQTLNNQSKTELKFYLPKSILKLKSEYTKDEIKEILNIYINYLIQTTPELSENTTSQEQIKTLLLTDENINKLQTVLSKSFINGSNTISYGKNIIFGDNTIVLNDFILESDIKNNSIDSEKINSFNIVFSDDTVLFNSIQNIINGSTNKIYRSNYNLILGKENNIIDSQYLIISGDNCEIKNSNNAIISGTNNNNGNYNFILGSNNEINKDYNNVIGENNKVDGFGNNIIGLQNELNNSNVNIFIGQECKFNDSYVNIGFGYKTNFKNSFRNFIETESSEIEKSNYNIISGYDHNLNKTTKSIIIGNDNTTKNDVSKSLILGYKNTIDASYYNVIIGHDNDIKESDSLLILSSYNKLDNSDTNIIYGDENNLQENSMYNLISDNYNSLQKSSKNIIFSRYNKLKEANNNVILNTYNDLQNANNNVILNKENKLQEESNNNIILKEKNKVNKSSGNIVNSNELTISESKDNYILGNGYSSTINKSTGNYINLGPSGYCAIENTDYSIINSLSNIDIKDSVGLFISVRDSKIENSEFSMILGGGVGGNIKDSYSIISTGYDNWSLNSNASLVIGYSSGIDSTSSSIVLGENNKLQNSNEIIALGDRVGADDSNHGIVIGYDSGFKNNSYNSVIIGTQSILNNTENSLCVSEEWVELNNCNNIFATGVNYKVYESEYSYINTTYYNLIFEKIRNSLIFNCKIGRNLDAPNGDNELNHSIKNISNSFIFGNVGYSLQNASNIFFFGNSNKIDHEKNIVTFADNGFNLFEIDRNTGATVTPTLTINDIEKESDKVLTTKEYVNTKIKNIEYIDTIDFNDGFAHINIATELVNNKILAIGTIDTKEDYQSIRFHIDIKDFEPFSVIKVLFKASIKKLLNANKDHYPIIDFKFNDAREIEDKIDFKRFYDFGANYIIKEFYNKYKDTEFENDDLVYFRIDLNIDYDTIVISNPFISILKEGV